MDLSYSKYHVNSATARPETTLGVWKSILHNRVDHPVKDNTCENLAGDGQKRDSSVISTVCSPALVFEETRKTRFAEEGSICEPEGGYTFFWKGKAENEVRIHGVGFAIRTSLLRHLPDLPTGINERLMKLRIPIAKSRHATIISAYAPTLSTCDEDKEAFYESLNLLVKSTPSSNKLIILGDFNARVGQDNVCWKGVLGPHGLGKMNGNGLLLLTMCTETDLTITNSLFRMANKYKTTWMHPRSKHWHLIYYVIVRRRDIRDVQITRAMRGAECWTDHRLVKSILSMHLALTHRKKNKAYSGQELA